MSAASNNASATSICRLCLGPDPVTLGAWIICVRTSGRVFSSRMGIAYNLRPRGIRVLPSMP